MSLLNKFFKLAADAHRAYSEYYEVIKEHPGLIVCKALIPDRPYMKESRRICDPSELAECREITTKEYLEAMEKTA